jgi:Nitroreductase
MKRNLVLALAALTVGAIGCTNPSDQKTENVMPSDTTLKVENVVVNTLLTRRSIRAYKPQIVPDEIMKVVLECGINAPNGMNKQPWEIRVVNDTAFLNGITRLQLSSMDKDDSHKYSDDPKFRNMFRNAPTVVFIAMEPGMCAQVDCGLLAGNMVNSAWAYGIGSCIQMGPVRFMKSEAAKSYLEALGFSEGYEILMAIGFGYPDENPDAKPRIQEKIRYVK